MTDLLVRLRPVELRDCEERALDYFSRDISSVDGELSYDDRAMSDRPDHYDGTDALVIRRGMGLNRLPKTMWRWLVEEAPTGLVSALPRGVHRRDVPDGGYPAVRARIEAALDGFIGETGDRRGLATATKMLHLKRPALMPICDSYTVAMLGVPLKPDGSKPERIAAGLAACDITRQAVQDNAAELDRTCEHLAGHGYPRTPVRVLDALLWLAYGGKIRPGQRRHG
jgi:Family of unknown function (DUF6308)